MTLKRLRLRETITIKKIVSFHYIELPNHYDEVLNYDFWQFVYVDKGELRYDSTDSFTLRQGNCIFVPPNLDRRGISNRHMPPNILVISFECKSSSIMKLANKPLHLGNEERSLLVQLINEGKNSLDPPPTVSSFVTRKKNPLLGSEQLIGNYLEILFIYIMRKIDERLLENKLTTASQEKSEKELADKLLGYIEDHISDDLSMDRLCNAFTISRTHLYNIFKKRTGTGIHEFVKKLRLEKAKIYIREEKYNYTEIAEKLGYSSIHYFSKDFKKSTGMSPSEYARTLKSMF